MKAVIKIGFTLLTILLFTSVLPFTLSAQSEKNPSIRVNGTFWTDPLE